MQRNEQALVLTFFAYFMFHATRKPPSIVKRCVLAARGALARACARASRPPTAPRRATANRNPPDLK
jgi:hypothetical protein